MIFAAIGSILWILILLFVVFALTGNVFFVVKQQHAVIIERLGKFNKIVGAGFPPPRSPSWTARQPQ